MASRAGTQLFRQSRAVGIMQVPWTDISAGQKQEWIIQDWCAVAAWYLPSWESIAAPGSASSAERRGQRVKRERRARVGWSDSPWRRLPVYCRNRQDLIGRWRNRTSGA